MAINLGCFNSKCKFYWEDMCTKNTNEEPMVINEQGRCETFEAGISDWYEQMEQNVNKYKK